MEKFPKARQKRQQKDELWKQLDAFDRNDQWSLQNAPNWLPKPVTNYIHLVKYTKRAAFAVENPTGKLRPVSPQGVERVRQLNKAYEDTMERIKARKIVRENIETAKLLGTGIAHVYWDEFHEGRMGATVLGDEGFQYEGEIKLKEIEPSTFYPDPNAFTLEDCEYIFTKGRKPYAWIKNHPKFKDKLQGKENEKAESLGSADERGEIYLRDYESQTDGLVDFTTYYEKKMNPETGGFEYRVAYLANGKVLLEEKMKPNRYPFVLLYDFKQRQDFWAMSTCQLTLDNQKIINKVESIITMIGVLLQNPQKIVTTSSGINPRKLALYGSAPQQVWQTNDSNPSQSIHFVNPPQIPQVLFQLLEQAKQNIREITGLTEAYMGQNVGSLQTSSGVQSLIDRSTMRDRDQMYDVEMYIADLSGLVIDFMTEYYQEERLIRTMGKKDEDPQFESFKGTDFKDLAYDIVVDVSAKAPITRMREVQEAKELLNTQGQYFADAPIQIIKPQEAIRMMNLVHGEEIIERMDIEEMTNKTEQAMQVAQMMHETMMQMEQGGQPVDQNEIVQMGMAMFEQMKNPQSQGQAGMPTNGNPTNIPQQF